MKGQAMAASFPTPETSLEMRQNVEAGLKADPDNARLLGLLGGWLLSDVLNGWNDAGNAEVQRAEEAARKAIGLDYNTRSAHHAVGWVHRLSGDHQAALDAFNEAIKIDPDFASAYAQAANELVLLGNARGAIPLAEKAAELGRNNASFQVFLWVKGRAHFVLGEYEDAVEALQESVRVRPNLWFTHAWLIAAYALTNREAEAKKVALDRFRQYHGPRADLDWIAGYYGEGQYRHPTVQAAVARLLYGLERAGLRSETKVGA
jgi:tetratricopeptide (TPR) repeat protein